MKIAIVGTGISGLIAAHRLYRDHDVTVFEADSRVGGHANTVDVIVDGVLHPVDTGFIVYNERNYPGFSSLLHELDVATQPTDMSFGVTDLRSGLQYRGSNLNTLFAQRRNLYKPSFLRLLTEIAGFNRAARKLVESDEFDHDHDDDTTLEEFVRRGGYSSDFVSLFLVPFGASIWSADPATFTQFPVLAYARFMHNHDLLNMGRTPAWRTLTGGSRRYVEALIAPFRDRILLSRPVHKIATAATIEDSHRVELVTDHGSESFERVVIATHSDQALHMLADASPAERSILGAIGYQRNLATLHTDERMLPINSRARASWNYAIDGRSRQATVTYWMNSLQSIASSKQLLVTLNRPDAIDPREVLDEFVYHHPVFDAPAMAAQRRRDEIQGRRGVYFAGAYWGYGFHEDGVQSGIDVAEAIGRGA